MGILYPDYNNCSVNFSNSILKKMGAKQFHESMPIVDKYLEKDYKNIVILLLDAMGKSIIEKNLDKDGFFASHLVTTFSAVFPPTTVAATTSIDSGLMPSEHAWLGWDCYYPQVDKNVTVFFNVEQGTRRPAADYNVPQTYCPYRNLGTVIKEQGGESYYSTPFMPPYPDTFDKVLVHVRELCDKPGRKHIYAYCSEPDHTMHETGCYSEKSRNVLRELERKVKALTDGLEDTIVFITADHGHIDSKNVALEDFPELEECLVRPPSIEPRALNLFVKEDRKAGFKELFRRLFGDEFLVFTKEEVLEKQLFGPGREHENFRSMLGDFLAVAVGGISIFNSKEEASAMIGVHAGMCEDEMLVPLIVVEKGRAV